MDPQRQYILVPLDTSPLAEDVLPAAMAIAQATNRTLRLMTVVAPTESLIYIGDPARIPPRTIQQWDIDEVAQARSYLAAVSQRVAAADVSVHTEVMVSSAVADSLLAYASNHPGVAMIAMITHGYTGFRHWTMGSVAETVLAATQQPLLLLRTQEPSTRAMRAIGLQTIVVPLDGTPFAEHALEEAQAIVRASTATLILVAVGPAVDDVGLAEGGVEPLWMLAERATAAAQIKEYMERTAQRLTSRGIQVATRFVTGPPADAILQASAEVQADLLVMATHGRHGLSRLLYGSIAHEVAQRAKYPVLLMRAHEAAS